MSYNPNIFNNPMIAEFWAKINSSSIVSITGATAAISNRMHNVSGVTSDYTIGLPPGAAVGTVVGFQVARFLQADKQYILDGGSDIAGRGRYIVLLHSNVVLLYYDGARWHPLVLSLDTKWKESGVALIEGSITNPTKGTTARDSLFWRRVGVNMEARYEFRQTGAGSGGSGFLLLRLPMGVDVDLTAIEIAATNTNANMDSNCGLFAGFESGYNRWGNMYVYDINRLAARSILHLEGGGSTGSGPENCNLGASDRRIGASVSVPIERW